MILSQFNPRFRLEDYCVEVKDFKDIFSDFLHFKNSYGLPGINDTAESDFGIDTAKSISA